MFGIERSGDAEALLCRWNQLHHALRVPRRDRAGVEIRLCKGDGQCQARIDGVLTRRLADQQGNLLPGRRLSRQIAVDVEQIDLHTAGETVTFVADVRVGDLWIVVPERCVVTKTGSQGETGVCQRQPVAASASVAREW